MIDIRQSMSFYCVFLLTWSCSCSRTLHLVWTASFSFSWLLFTSVLITMQWRTIGANWYIWPPLIATIFCVVSWRNMEQNPLEENWQRAGPHRRLLIGEITRVTERRSLTESQLNSSRTLPEDIMWPTPAWRTQGTVYKRRSCQVEDTACSAL